MKNSPTILFFISISGILLLFVIVFFVYTTLWSADTSDTPTTFPTVDEGDVVSPAVADSEPYMEAVDGARVSTAGLVEHVQANELSQGFYQVTTDSERYDIFYNDGNKNIFILLYQEPLAFARSLAEEELKAALEVDEAALCDLGIQVRTNEFVNPQYAGFNFGLSFCPGATSLENI